MFTACAQSLVVVSGRYVCTLKMVEASAFLIPQCFPGIRRFWRSCDQVEQHSCTLTKGRNFFCQNDRHSFLEPGPLVQMVRGAHYLSVDGTAISFYIVFSLSAVMMALHLVCLSLSAL